MSTTTDARMEEIAALFGYGLENYDHDLQLAFWVCVRHLAAMSWVELDSMRKVISELIDSDDKLDIAKTLEDMGY